MTVRLDFLRGGVQLAPGDDDGRCRGQNGVRKIPTTRQHDFDILTERERDPRRRGWGSGRGGAAGRQSLDGYTLTPVPLSEDPDGDGDGSAAPTASGGSSYIRSKALRDREANFLSFRRKGDLEVKRNHRR